MTDTGGSDQATEDDIAVEIEDPGPENYDPHQYVPEFVDPMTASGLVRMHEALNDENALRSAPSTPRSRLTTSGRWSKWATSLPPAARRENDR